MSTTLNEKIAVMQAALEGRTIEHRTHGFNWNVLPVDDLSWNWLEVDYRVKREPRVVYLAKDTPLTGRHAASCFTPSGYEMHVTETEKKKYNKFVEVLE